MLSTLYRRTVGRLPSIELDRPSSERSDTHITKGLPAEDVFVHNLGDYSREEPTHALDASLVLEPTLAEIADSLNAAGSCWRLSTEDAERPYHRTMREVTRVELQRSAWLIEGFRLLTQRPTLKKSNRNLGGILD